MIPTVAIAILGQMGCFSGGVVRSEQAFGRGHAVAEARIATDGHAQRAAEGLEQGFCNMMAVGALECVHVQRDAGMVGQALEELAHQFGIELADAIAWKTGMVEQDRKSTRLNSSH